VTDFEECTAQNTVMLLLLLATCIAGENGKGGSVRNKL